MNFAIASTPDERRRTFHALDAARGIAALLVVLHHVPVADSRHVRRERLAGGRLLQGLSGLVLAHAYMNRLVDGRLSVRDFMVARLVRLDPLYLISLLGILVLGAGMYLADVPVPWSAFAMAGKLPFAFLTPPSPTLDWQAYLFPLNIAVVVDLHGAGRCRRVRAAPADP